MAARRVLAKTVALRDPKTLEIVVLRSGDVPPAWAKKMIKNPDLLVTEAELESEPVGGDPAGEDPAGAGHTSGAASEPGAGAEGEGVENDDESSGPHAD